MHVYQGSVALIRGSGASAMCGMGVQGLANASYFVPDSRYAVGAGPHAAAEEFQSLVQGLHARGLEVLIQVPPSPPAAGCMHCQLKHQCRLC